MRILVAIAVLALASCVPTTTTVQGNFQARSPEAAQLRNIAIAAFSGRYGADFTSRLTASLTSAQVDGSPYFTISTNVPGSVRDVAGATAFGRRHSVSGVYFGETNGEVVTQVYQERRVRCVREGDESCASTQEYAVRCWRANASFSATPRLVDVRTGTIPYSDSIAGSASEDWCEDRLRRGSDALLMGAAQDQAVGTLRTAVAPYSRNLAVELKTRSSSLRGADAQQFAGAVEFAQQGRMDRACGIWETMAVSYPQNIEILYDRGVCAEASGDFTRALELYGAADGLLASPDRMISDALSRARRLASGRES